jgi:hypothetical protein
MNMAGSADKDVRALKVTIREGMIELPRLPGNLDAMDVYVVMVPKSSVSKGAVISFPLPETDQQLADAIIDDDLQHMAASYLVAVEDDGEEDAIWERHIA